MTSFSARIRPHVTAELGLAAKAESRGDAPRAFAHLERAHVLGQASTREHVRVHGEMFRWGLRQGDTREAVGQLLRIVGAATQTAFGLVPSGNTGGAKISPFTTLPLDADVAEIIERASKDA